MASSQNKAYLLPDNHTPEGYRCLTVYIPDDDLYLWQFMGAYDFFGTWVAWERDALHRGAEAAATWKEAIELTRDLMNCDLPDYTNPFNNIADAIRDIQIGGGCCTPGTVDDPVIITIPPDETGNPPDYDTDPYDPDGGGDPPDGYPDWDTWKDAKCLAANYMADQIIGLANSLGALGAITAAAVGAVVSVIFLILPASWVAVIGALDLLMTALLLLQLLVSDGVSYYSVLSGLMSADRETLVCILYDWISAADIGAALSPWLADLVDQLSLSQTSKDKLTRAFDYLLGSRITNWYVAQLENAVPDGYVGTTVCETACLPASECGERGLPVGIGTVGNAGETGIYNLASEYLSGLDMHRITLYLGANHCMSAIASDWTKKAGLHAVRIEKCPTSVLRYEDDNSPDFNGKCGGYVDFIGNAPFTVDLTIEEENPDCIGTCLTLVVDDNMDDDKWELFGGRDAFADYSGDFEAVLLPNTGVNGGVVFPFNSLVLSLGEKVQWSYIDIDIDVRQNFLPNTLTVIWNYDDGTSESALLSIVYGTQTIRLNNPQQKASITTLGTDMVQLIAEWDGGGSNADLLDAVWILRAIATGVVILAP